MESIPAVIRDGFLYLPNDDFGKYLADGNTNKKSTKNKKAANKTESFITKIESIINDNMNNSPSDSDSVFDKAIVDNNVEVVKNEDIIIIDPRKIYKRKEDYKDTVEVKEEVKPIVEVAKEATSTVSSSPNTTIVNSPVLPTPIVDPISVAPSEPVATVAASTSITAADKQKPSEEVVKNAIVATVASSLGDNINSFKSIDVISHTDRSADIMLTGINGFTCKVVLFNKNYFGDRNEYLTPGDDTSCPINAQNKALIWKMVNQMLTNEEIASIKNAIPHVLFEKFDTDKYMLSVINLSNLNSITDRGVWKNTVKNIFYLLKSQRIDSHVIESGIEDRFEVMEIKSKKSYKLANSKFIVAVNGDNVKVTKL